MRDSLADRIRSHLATRPGIGEIAMFGGLCFTQNGHMLVAAMRSGNLLVRVGKDGEAAALADPAAKRLSAGSRQMAGYVEMDTGTLDDLALGAWIEKALACVAPLPPKKEGARTRRAAPAPSRL